MANYKNNKEKESSTAVVEVEAKKIEVVESYELSGQIDTEGALNLIKPKHKDKHFAWPSQKNAKISFNRWKWLKFVNGSTDVEETKEWDLAEKTQDNVLCWRERSFQDLVDAEIRNKNLKSMRIEGSNIPKKEMDDQIRSLGIPGLSTKPLED